MDNAAYKCIPVFGSKELRSWFELQPDGSALGMGMVISRDMSGNILDVKIEPTGILVTYER